MIWVETIKRIVYGFDFRFLIHISHHLQEWVRPDSGHDQTVKLELYSGISYWYVFTPLFVASAFNCYFLFIVFVRTIIDEKDCKAPFLKYAFSWLRLVMLGVFEALLCYKINGDLEDGQVAVQSSYGVIFLPIWVLMAALCFQACRLL
uniref:Transmembrane protein n=1 Tax=Ascaris lumbricoides TaxID=6252 RepID=A0A0M3I316_ASCLU